MRDHHFQIDQLVIAHALGVPEGPYSIMCLLPLIDGMPQYRAKSTVDDHERAFPENALSAIEPAIPKALRPAKRRPPARSSKISG
jgi:hypothetical protein